MLHISFWWSGLGFRICMILWWFSRSERILRINRIHDWLQGFRRIVCDFLGISLWVFIWTLLFHLVMFYWSLRISFKLLLLLHLTLFFLAKTLLPALFLVLRTSLTCILRECSMRLTKKKRWLCFFYFAHAHCCTKFLIPLMTDSCCSDSFEVHSKRTEWIIFIIFRIFPLTGRWHRSRLYCLNSQFGFIIQFAKSILIIFDHITIIR
jgi:hypothetical protein